MQGRLWGFFFCFSFFFFSASQTAKWMFEHLGGGLMRTLISYSDLLMLPPSILGSGNNGKGFAEKALKDDLLGFHSLGRHRFREVHAAGVPKTEILGLALGWKSTFSHHLGRMWKAAACWATLIPIMSQGKIFRFVGFFIWKTNFWAPLINLCAVMVRGTWPKMMDAWMNRCKDKQMQECTDEQMHGCKDGRKDWPPCKPPLGCKNATTSTLAVFYTASHKNLIECLMFLHKRSSPICSLAQKHFKHVELTHCCCILVFISRFRLLFFTCIKKKRQPEKIDGRYPKWSCKKP